MFSDQDISRQGETKEVNFYRVIYKETRNASPTDF